MLAPPILAPAGQLAGRLASACGEFLPLPHSNSCPAPAGEVGDRLEREAGEATKAVTPRLTFVPWAVVNGVQLGMDFENLGKYVCASYSGKRERPAACGVAGAA